MPDQDISHIRLKGVQKAAILLIALGPKDSASILKHLPEDDADRLTKTIARCEQVTQENVEFTLDEYIQFVTSEKLLVRGGIEYAHKLLVEAFGQEVADRLIARADSKMMEGTPSQRADSHLAAAAPRVLAKEHFYDGVVLDGCEGGG